MAVFSSRQHTHIALAVPKKNGDKLPLIKHIKVHPADMFFSDLANLLCHGETINVGDKSFYLISHLSVTGKKYGAAAIIRKLLNDVEPEAFNSNLHDMATQLNTIRQKHEVGA